MNGILVIARLTFHEAARRRILLAAIALGGLFLAVYATGIHFLSPELEQEARVERNTVINFIMLAGLYVVNFLFAAMAVLTSVDTLSGEITSGAIHTVVSKPIRRLEVVLGKWLGYTTMLTLYLLLMGGGVMAIIWINTGYVAPNPMAGLALIWLTGVLLLNISLLGGSSLSTISNGVMVFGLYGVAFVGGWIEQIGALLQNETAMNVGIVSSLIFPSEALWKRAAYEMQSPLVQALGVSPFSPVSSPSDLMVLYAAAFALLALALATIRFSRRDL